MTILNVPVTLSELIDHAVKTGAAEDDTLASTQLAQEADRAAWQRVIDDYLVEWGRIAPEVGDEDLVAPSTKSLERACDLAIRMRDEGMPGPLRVVLDGEGGVSFEHRHGNLFASLNVLQNGSIEAATFRDCRLIARYPIG